MEKIRKSAGTASKIAGICRTLCIVWLVFCVLGAVCSFAMQGFIAQFYENPDNLLKAQESLNADMGIFNFINFESIKEAGNFGVFFGIQLICSGVVALVYIYLFTNLKKCMMNICDTGKAFLEADAPSYKKSFIILTIALFLFNGLGTAIIAGIILCGLYNVTAATFINKEQQ